MTVDTSVTSRRARTKKPRHITTRDGEQLAMLERLIAQAERLHSKTETLLLNLNARLEQSRQNDER